MIWNYAFCVLICLAVFSEASPQFGRYPENHVGAINICSSCSCGLVKSSRIVGGQRSQHNEFPWLVKIQHMFYENRFCGGTLISPRHILTAAHCFHNEDPGFLSIDLADGTQRFSKDLHEHPSFDRATFKNDLAIITMEEPVEFNGSVKRVCLPREGQDFNGTNGIIAGWGLTAETDRSNRDLHTVMLPILTVDECAQSSYSAERLSKNIFCAGYLQGGRDACKGDSGGPFYVRENGRMVLAGVISNGKGCARPGYPGIYTKVTNYLGWISQIIEDECICINLPKSKL